MDWFWKKKEEDLELHRSFSAIRRDTNNVFQWINWLKKNHDVLHEKHHSHAELSLRRDQRLKEDLEDIRVENDALRATVMEMYDYMQTLHCEFKKIHAKHKELTNVPIEEPKFEESIIESEPVQLLEASQLTSSEQTLITALYSSHKPLSYEELASNIGINYGTVKNRLSRIKKKGISIEFVQDDDGQRRFYLHDDEKVRLTGR